MAIAPDLGERYLDTVYQTNWLEDLFGKDVLDPVRAGQQFLEGLSRSAEAGAATLAGRRPISTATEAVLKATGQGLGLPPDGLVVTPPSTPPRVLYRDGPEPVWLRDLSAPAGFVAALAGLGTAPDDVVPRDAGPLLRQTNRRLSGPTTRSQRYP